MLFKQRDPIFLFFHSLFFSEMYFDPYRTRQMLQGKSSADCNPLTCPTCPFVENIFLIYLIFSMRMSPSSSGSMPFFGE